MVFGEFATLAVERERAGISAGEAGWILTEKVTVRGIGGPLAMAVRDEVNALREPFAMTWRRRGAMPWDWELVCVDHPALDLPR